ncbi:HpcH/HpaI aldolase/citrate lyase family protein [Actinomycetes bacterium M1A6_2h]
MSRSFLYVPAMKPSLFDKAVAGEADAVIIDLEDAVPLPDKESARNDVAHWLQHRERSDTEVWVRVTPEFLDQDLAAATFPGVRGIMIAKCSVDALDRADVILTGLESAHGCAPLAVIGLIETAHALRSVAAMATRRRVLTFGIGEVDLLADLRIARVPDTAAVIDSIRMDVVIACAAASLDAPIAPTSTDFRDLDGFVTSTEHFVNMGFRGRTALHPSQVPIINVALTPSAGELERAQRLLDLYALADGGPTVDDRGHFVDEAVVRGAREILARA